MNAPRHLDLLREVLDHEVVDSAGVSCGMVDDIEFLSTPGGLEVAALRLGPAAWGPRLPALLALLAERIFGIHGARVGWEHVADVSEVIHLDARASELGLGELDRKAGRWLARIPGG